MTMVMKLMVLIMDDATVLLLMTFKQKQKRQSLLVLVPVNAVRGREDVAVGDEHAAAVAGRPVPHEGCHPRPFLRVGVLSAYDASWRPLGDQSATCGWCKGRGGYIRLNWMLHEPEQIAFANA